MFDGIFWDNTNRNQRVTLLANQPLFDRSTAGTINMPILQEEINQRGKDQEEGDEE